MAEALPLQLDRAAEEALVYFLRVVAAGEVIIEQRRAQLCASPGFHAPGVFAVLASSAKDPSRRLSYHVYLDTLQHWLISEGAGPPSDSPLLLNELSRVLLRSLVPPCWDVGMGYADFLRLVLPRTELYQEVRMDALTTCGGLDAEELPRNVANAFRRLIEEEVSMIRRTAELRRKLDVQLTPGDIFALLRGKSGFVATVVSFTELLYKELGAMTPEQVAALFLYVDASGSGTVNLDDVTLLVEASGAFDVTTSGDADGAIFPFEDPVATIKNVRAVDGPLPSTDAQQQLCDVLTVLVRLAEQDVVVEEAKAKLKACQTNACIPEATLVLLDRNGKGYVTEMDIWEHLRGAGRNVLFTKVHTLALAIVEGSSLATDSNTPSLHLSLRDICELVLPRLSAETKLVRDARDDAETLSGLRRLASVELRHLMMMSAGRPQRTRSGAGLDQMTQEALLDVIEAAAEAAAESSLLRRGLSQTVPFIYRTPIDALAAALTPIATNRSGIAPMDLPIRAEDLRASLRSLALLQSDSVFDLIWDRIAGSTAVLEVPLYSLVCFMSPAGESFCR